jgi:5-formyltetrahydrofolate cyclo-ligase
MWRSKEEIRETIWRVLEQKGIADFPKPCYGRIPNFIGSKDVSEKIRLIPEFKDARCVFCAPDFVLKRIREIVLETHKVLAVALPHMTEFLQIAERRMIAQATSINGFKRFGAPLKTVVDLFVQGSVAVDRYGNRLGKGKGYGDKEWEYLISRNLLSPDTKVVTLVHECQILEDFSHLVSQADKKVDYIITQKGIIKTCERRSLKD